MIREQREAELLEFASTVMLQHRDFSVAVDNSICFIYKGVHLRLGLEKDIPKSDDTSKITKSLG